jgi:predicted ATPase/DNA-binding SARP family transcriptional activator
MLKLYFFGAPRLEHDDHSIEVRLRKPLALWVYLAVTNRHHSRDSLADLLWPGYPATDARANLRRALSDLNASLPVDLIESNRQTIGLRQDREVWLDVAVFRRLASGDGGADARLDRLEQAADLYTADFLEGFSLPDAPDFEAWQQAEAGALTQELAAVLDRLASTYAEQGEYDRALTHARRRLGLDPFDEAAHRMLMRLYAWSGQTAAALRQYETCARTIRLEMDLEPQAETTALWQQIRANQLMPPDGRSRPVTRPEQPQPEMAVDLERALPPHNLSPQPTRFIGRQEDLFQVGQRLADPDVRLLTILGVGGMGKSRLAVEAAAQALGHFADGVWFVSLAPIQDRARLAPAILETLNLSANADDLVESLCQSLHKKRILLVLDNFEQLLPAAPDLSRILAAAPEVKMVVTSRERLNLREEWLYPLQGLDFPAEDGSTPGQAPSGALDLFSERMQQVQPGFTLAGENWAWAVRICRLAGGMPLALELAAAWGELLSCREIAEEMERSLDFLESDTRNVADRHRSIRAVFDHSWRLLSPAEQVGLRKLSAFHSSFEREAAQAVAGASLPLLLGLVRKSLLQRSEDGRFEIHEVLRQFMAEKLAETGEVETVAAAHATYYISFLHQQCDDTLPDLSKEALDAMQREIEHIRRAWQWAVARLDLVLMQRAVYGLTEFALLRTWLPQTRVDMQMVIERLDRAWPESEIAAPGGESRLQFLNVRGQLLCYLSNFRRRGGQHREALNLARQAVDHIRQSDNTNPAVMLRVLQNYSLMLMLRGDLEEASAQLVEALKIVDNTGYDAWASTVFERQAEIAREQGRYTDARLLLLRCIEVAERHAIHSKAGWGQTWLAEIEVYLGDYQKAKSASKQARITANLLDTHFMKHLSNIRDLQIHLLTEGPHTATDVLERLVEDHDHHLQGGGRLNDTNQAFADYYRLSGDLQRAAELLAGILNKEPTAAEETSIALKLAHLLLEMGDVNAARENALRSWQKAQTIGDKRLMASAQITLAEIELNNGGIPRSEIGERLKQAITWSHRVGTHPTTLDGLYVLSRLLATGVAVEQRQTVEFLMLILAHRSATWETKEKANKLLSKLAAELPLDVVEDARRSGASLDLDRVVTTLQSGT